jgi:hypothetical protein
MQPLQPRPSAWAIGEADFRVRAVAVRLVVRRTATTGMSDCLAVDRPAGVAQDFYRTCHFEPAIRKQP